MRRVLALLLVCAGIIAACESRPPVDVTGHKDSVYKRLTVGVPF